MSIDIHGIKLYGDIADFRVESLASKTPLSAGMGWFNTGTKKLQYSILDAGDAVVSRNFYSSEDADVRIAAEAAQTAGSGVDLFGYEGSGAQTNGLFALSAGNGGSVLDAVAAGIDAEMKATDNFILDMASQTAAASKGTRLLGFEGNTSGTLSVAASSLNTALDTIINSASANLDTVSALGTNLSTNYLNKTTSTPQTITANLTLTGNLTVQGTTTTVNSETVVFADNSLLLNSNVVSGAPTENASIAISRGDEDTIDFIQWNEDGQAATSFTSVPVWTGSAFEQQEVGTKDWITTYVTNNAGTEVTNIRNFIGKDSEGANTPTYASVTQVTQSVTLEAAIGQLDAIVGADVATAQVRTTGLIAAANTVHANIEALDDAIGPNVTSVLNLSASASSNANLSALDVALGTVSTLDTTATTVTAAINEVHGEVNTNTAAVGTLGSLTTTAKGNLVAAINELDADLATEAGARATADSNILTEINAIETAMGTVLAADGTFVVTALDAGNYMDAATTVTGALISLDAQVKTNADAIAANGSALGTEVDAIETTIGASIAADGTFTVAAFSGTNSLVAAADLTDALIKLDTAIEAQANADSAEDGFLRAFMGKTAAGSETPTYSSATQVTQSATLEAAIGEIDAKIGADVTTGALVVAASTVHVNLQAIDTAIGTNVTNGTYILAANKMNANIQALDTQANSVQTEVNAIETASGGVFGADGTYSTGLSTGNYMAGATLAAALLALDTQTKTNTDAISTNGSNIQTEVDAIETASGGVFAANGTFGATALDAGNYMDAATDLAAAMIALDSQIKTNADNIGTIGSLPTTATNLVAAITEVHDNVNAGKFNSGDLATATVHTITHNLNTKNILVDYSVYDTTELAWKKDIGELAIIDDNSFSITFFVTQQVRVSVLSNDAI